MYQRRQPESSLLHQTVRANWRNFLCLVEEEGGGLPGFVKAEVERFLECGILAKGFARVRCGACGHESLVAFSCKGRGFCPSCSTRRMQGTAAHLVDRVLPRVPVRQWVLSLPKWARFLLARDPGRITSVLERTLRIIFASHRRRARREGARDGRCGAITFVQRFGGALNLNVHLHCVVPDGVWIPGAGGDAAPSFVRLPPPADQEVQRILTLIEARVRVLLGRERRRLAEQARPDDAWSATQAESVEALRGPPPTLERAKRLAAYCHGFSLHAGVHLHANDREGIARLCGYGSRPALTQDRLVSLSDGRLGYRLKRPRRDGAMLISFTPEELIRRLCSLVPPPRSHLVRYHGVFAPNSAWRKAVVPAVPAESRPEPEPSRLVALTRPRSSPRPPAARIPWADLLQRIFLFDVLACPCGGRRKVIAFINERAVIERILAHLNVSITGPPLRAPPGNWPVEDQSTASEWADPPWQDEVPVISSER